MMNRGMTMMVESLIKMLGLDPVKMMDAVEQIRKSLYTASVEMQTIRRQNDLLMAKFGLTLENEDGKERSPRPDSGEHGNGDGARLLNGSGTRAADTGARD